MLWAYLWGIGDTAQSGSLLEKPLRGNPALMDRVYGARSTIYAAMGYPKLAKQYHEKAEVLRLKEYDQLTVDNYHRLITLLDRHGVRLVCVQYPMRSVEPLKKIFQGQTDGIVFVDSEKVFKDAVKRSSLREYFEDMFAGDFGHCPDKGNKLLAENIAAVLARDVFRK